MRHNSPESALPRELEPRAERFIMTMIERKSPYSAREGKPSQDVGFMFPEEGLAGVFDGVGGAKDGEIASRLARDEVEQGRERLKHETDSEKIKAIFREVLLKANASVADLAATLKNNMGTTALIAKLVKYKTGTKLFLGWVGDSRAHLVREGQASILTLDDTMWFKYENIPEDSRHEAQTKYASEDVKRPLGSNVVSQSLGAYKFHLDKAGAKASTYDYVPIKPNILEIDLLPGDQVILSTDGLHDPVPLPTIGKIVSENPPEQAAAKLVEAVDQINNSNSPRRKKDDLFIVIMSEDTVK